MDHSHISLRHLTARLFILFLVLFSVTGRAHAGDDPLLNTPPGKPIRIPAEFEPMQAVVVGWDVTLGDLYRYIAEDVRLIMLWKSQDRHDDMQRLLPGYGVNMDNCEFYQVSYTPWNRDGLPWFIFTDHNEPAFVHNQLASHYWSVPQYGLAQGYPVYRSGLSVQGGDFMTDGQGTAVSLDTVSRAHAEMGDEFDERVRDYWGVHTYHFLPNERWGAGGYMHIDCLAKFLSPDAVMVVKVPPSDVRRESSEETAAYFGRQVSCYGTPYRVVRVDVPDREPYINSLIVNRRVFLPIVDGESDANAIASYEAAMPGYEVIGISSRFEGYPETLWEPFMALHCLTMGIPDEQMLYIEHTPVLDRPPTSEGFPIGAKIVAHSRTAFVEGTPVVWWRTLADVNEAQPESESPQSWNTAPMARQAELGEHQYLAHIPSQPVGTVVQYYLQAQDASGRNETHPYIGEAQAHTFTVNTLGADVSAISAQRGGTIRIFMNAGVGNAQQDYRLTYSLGTDAACPEESDSESAIDSGLPPSQSTALPATTVFSGFSGVLDDLGIGTARVTVSEALPSDWVGSSLRFSLELDDQQNTVPGTLCIQILD